MNTTFRVIFNKVRGTLMVVNELTSSVQSKGTTLVKAAAVGAMVLAAAASGAVELSGTVAEDKTFTDDTIIVNPSNDRPKVGDSTYAPGLFVQGSDVTLEGTSTVTFNSVGGSGYHLAVVGNGGHLTIKTDTLVLGHMNNGESVDRGIRVVGDGSQLTILAKNIQGTTADEMIHLREGHAVANIGTAEQRVEKITLKNESGKNDWGVSLLHVNEGSELNLYAVDASFDGPTSTIGGVFGSGTHGTLNVDVSGTLTIDGNLSGSYGAMNQPDTTFAMNVKANHLQMKGNVNAGPAEEAYSTFHRHTNITVTANDGKIDGDITAREGATVSVSGSNTSALSVTGSVVALSDSQITLSNVSVGGGISAQDTATVLVSGTADGTTAIEGSVYGFDSGKVTLKNVVLSDDDGTGIYAGNASKLAFENVKIQGKAFTYSGGAVLLDTSETVTFTNVDLLNNTEAGSNNSEGGAVHTTSKLVQTGGSYVGNKAVANSSTEGVKGAWGGALFVKGTTATFTDVLFSNNTATVTAGENNTGRALGGAVLVDYATEVHSKGSVVFNVTKDMTYSGNNVSSNSTQSPLSTYEYDVLSAQAGGFLFLDRGSTADFNIADGATLTIGNEGATGDMDSIASSIAVKGTDVNGGIRAKITKNGAGKLVINSSLDKYYGDMDLNEGAVAINSDWTVHGAVTLNKDATLTFKSLTLGAADEAHNVVAGTFTMNGGSLTTTTDQLFNASLGADGTVTDPKGLKTGITLKGGTVSFTDAKYNLDYATAAKATGSSVMNFTGTMIAKDGGEVKEATSDQLVAKPGETQKVYDTVTAKSTTDVALENGQSLGVKAISLEGEAKKVTVKEGATITLVGATSANESLVKAAADVTPVVEVDSGVLNVGQPETTAAATQGALPSLDLKGTAKVNIANFVGTVESIKADEHVVVNVGTTAAAAAIKVASIDDFKGTLFVDPAWKNNETLDVIGNASHLEVSQVGTLEGNVIAGRNALVTIGNTTDAATAAFNKLASEQGLSWGPDNVTAAVYLDSPITVGAGSITSNGALTAAPTGLTAGTVTVVAKSLLMVNQANASSGAYITGKLTNNGTVAIVNSKEGSFQLASTVDAASNGDVIADNAFIDATLDQSSGKVTLAANGSSLAQAFGSAGLQQSIRRADWVLASTIADRTALDQNVTEGLNLWADVRGEHNEADSLDNGASYKSNIGYGTFGADVGVTQGVRVGAAVQYGKGSVRSDAYSVRNEVDSVGLTGYASWQPTDATKVVAEVAYTWGGNDITSGVEKKFDQSVDTKLLSAGVTAQYQTRLGAFSVIPSIGVRVSKLDTDALHVGSITVDDQSQTIVQLPIALRVTGADMNAAGWTFAPTVKVAYVPTFGDDEVSIGNVNQSVLDMSPVQGEFGIRAMKGSLLFNADFLLGGGQNGTSTVGGKVGVRYAF